jgi:CheY-like chemotaxis protein
MNDFSPPQLLRVLMVDDCLDTTASMALLLGLWGHDARTAPDGPSALLLAEVYRPDVVLLDVGLPGMDGHQVALRLRGRLGLEAALLVAVSGYARAADCHRSLEAGCDLHWVKPVEPDDLRQLLAARQEMLQEAPCSLAEGAILSALDHRLPERGLQSKIELAGGPWPPPGVRQVALAASP